MYERVGWHGYDPHKHQVKMYERVSWHTQKAKTSIRSKCMSV